MKASTSTELKKWARDDENSKMKFETREQELTEKLKDRDEEITSHKIKIVSLESNLDGEIQEKNFVITNYNELKTEHVTLASQYYESQEADIHLQELSTEHMATVAQLHAVFDELSSRKSISKAMIDKLKGEISHLKFENRVLEERCGNSNNEYDLTNAVLKVKIRERDDCIADLEAKLLKGENIRRAMHNCLSELRGNIQVFARIRPLLEEDGTSETPSIQAYEDGESLSINETKFSFNKVFPPSTSQESIFNEVSNFVQSALDGYHVCLFSYGQTGSGKTFTMQGIGNETMRGIIPRAVEHTLSKIKTLNDQSWTFQVTANFLEIYNEELKDLLTTHQSNRVKNMKPTNSKLLIRRSKNNRGYVEGLSKVTIDTNHIEVARDKLKELMTIAERSRSVASTQMNSQSSRSHSVFILNINGINERIGTIIEGSLNLCDLAGSERLNRSNAAADPMRLKETQSINKSLSCLGDVFTALSNSSTHVPYRNSKLTYLLQDCLSGDGKALMFIILSPTDESKNESLCSLRFAQRVKKVELGKATKHVKDCSPKKPGAISKS